MQFPPLFLVPEPPARRGRSTLGGRADAAPMVDFVKLPVHDNDGDVHVVVETTRGSAAKLKFDPELKVFTLSKALILGLTYPYDWGFIPSTKGQDGDPVDALVLHDAATAPGLVLNARSSVCSKFSKARKVRRASATTGLSPCPGTPIANRPTRMRGHCPSKCGSFLWLRTSWKTSSSNFSAGRGRRPANA